jgi:hypothetical protein
MGEYEECMIIISGQTYSTIIDAAKEFEVSAKTIRQYIASRIIPEPPVIQFGNRTVKHFPKEYMAAAKRALQLYRTGRSGKG